MSDAFAELIEKRKKERADKQNTFTPTQAITSNQQYTPYADIQQDVDHTTLHQNQSWLKASKKFYQMTYGQMPNKNSKELSKYDGDTYEERLADYGLKQMAGYNYNLGDMSVDTKRLLDSDQETKEAFIYLLDQYDEVNTSWHTAKQAGWEMFTDITNWAGLLTLGTGAAISQTAKLGMKEATRATIKKSLKEGIHKAQKTSGLTTSARRSGALGAVEGSLHAGAMGHLEQVARIDAGQQSEYVYQNTLLPASIGLVAGGTFGTLFDLGISKAATKMSEKKINRLIDTTKTEIKKTAEEAQLRIDEAERLASGKPKTKPVSKDQLELELKEEEIPLNSDRRASGDRRDSGRRAGEGEDVVDKIKQAQNIDNVIFKTVDDLPEELRKFLDTGGTSKDNFEYETNLSSLWSDPVDLRNKLKSGELTAEQLIKDFEANKYTPKQTSDIKSMINASNKLLEDDFLVFEKALLDETISKRELLEEAEYLYDILEESRLLLDNVNAYSGRDLQDIQNHMIFRNARGKIGDEVTQEVYEEAQRTYFKKVLNDIDDKLNKDINDQFALKTKEGNDKAAELIMNRQNNPIRKQVVDELEKLGYHLDDKSTLTEKFVEMSISGVFSPSTVVYNTVFPFLKTWTYPLIDTISTNPLDRLAWRRTFKIYSQMRGATGAAMQAARAAAAYDQTLLTRDPARFLEGGIKTRFKKAGFIGGKAAGFLRAYPRLLGSSDAYNQEVAAAGVLTMNAFDALMSKGAAKGLKGDALKEYVDVNIKSEINKAYDFSLTAEKIKPIYEKGVALNLTGDKLEQYVKRRIEKEGGKGTLKTLGNKAGAEALRKEAKELARKNPDSKAARNKAAALRQQADDIEKAGDDALLAVQELLYKKEFKKGGQGITGKIEHGAAVYEDFTKDHPWTKIVGNLFFRTPAWLFHESLRLTPALNALLPNFRKDMAGVNGVHRQARARTEAAVGYAWMLMTISKWSQGEMTGSPNQDFTKRGETYRSSMRPLSIDIGDGKEMNFARWEPLRIPATIVINALDGYMEHQNKINTGGFPEDLEIPAAVSKSLGVAYVTAISAIKDSGLTQGITDSVGTVFNMGNFLRTEEDQFKAFDKLFDYAAKKTTAVIPSTISKTQQAFGGAVEKTSIATAKDRVIASVLPNHESISRQYDFLGNTLVQEAPDTRIGGFFGAKRAFPFIEIGHSTPESRAGNRTKAELNAIDFVAKLEDAGFGNLTRTKYRDSRFPKDDLRNLMTTLDDGTEVSVFDAMMIEVKRRSKTLTKALNALDRSNAPLGSPKSRNTWGLKVQLAHKFIRDTRNDALDLVILKDPKLREAAIEREIDDLELSVGRFKSR